MLGVSVWAGVIGVIPSCMDSRQSDYEHSACKLVIQHIAVAMREMFSVLSWSVNSASTGGLTDRPPRTADVSLLGLYLGRHRTFLMYAAHVGNEEALHHRTAHACQTILNYSVAKSPRENYTD
jgi:hypothetical protein